MTHYVIIGGGIAGTSAAEQLRKLDPQSEITLLSNEEHPLYSRVLLPHYITGKSPRERVFLKSFDWYKEKNIHLVFQEVQSLNTDRQQVITSSGATYTYDKLLIAGGGIVRQLPFDKNNAIYHLQTIEDADRIKHLLDTRGNETRTSGIIGGGFIAMELVALFAKKEWKTHLFLRGEKFFSHTFDRAASQLLEEHLSNHGVTTHKNTTITSYNDGMAKTHENGAFAIDVLAAGIGISSQFNWVSDAGILVASGVITNEFLETNTKNVWAAGDCAEYVDSIVKRPLHTGNWMNAQMQGRHVALNMTGEHKPFELVSSYATHVLGVDIIGIADAALEKADHVIARDYRDGRTLLMVRDNHIVGASIINRNKDRGAITRLIKEQVTIEDIKDQLADPTVDLKSLLSES